ncbi:esterase FE4-like [Physella acuta]|uniref:esterase FE4-like n=1 Tax=Physella acuta TaxID=109671 RepID=UPI0027DAF62C|nr:esterase FE4-like [Physella acuta]XP_059158768.1 esterase FE4-like [Physella acuta]
MLLLLLMLYLYVCHALSPDPTVTSPSGKYRGTTLTSPAGLRYNAFLGIPFALPPTGALRFAKPVPYPKIEDVFIATKRGPVCIQSLGVDLGTQADEDCLYLNVYLPIHAESNPNHLKKVFVYIHGGGYFMGSANEQVPGDLVTQHDVIVVTLNYRLSWLGFLRADDPQLPGNQAIWDQILALKWVRKNIRSFGGDPNHITIGGNSVGSISVSVLSIVRQAKYLFHRAFLMSGSAFQNVFTASGSPALVLEYISNTVGCTSADLQDKIQCLKTLPSSAYVLPIIGTFPLLFLSRDGELFPAPIMELVKNTTYLKHVGFFERDYLVSITNNEGPIAMVGLFSMGIDPTNFTIDHLSQILQTTPTIAQMTLDFYTGLKLPFPTLYHLIGDYILDIPTLNFIKVLTSYVTDYHKRAYYMVLNYTPTLVPPLLNGFPHALDVSYLFDIRPDDVIKLYYRVNTGLDFTEEDRKLKKVYMNIVAGFIKKGDPSWTLASNLTWPPFDLRSQHFLNFDQSPHVDQFPIHQRQIFWETTFNSML